jgi:hypothetical protein
MKTAVTGEDDDGHIIYNRSLIALGRHYVRNPVQRGQRFHGKGDSNPVKADSR